MGKCLIKLGIFFFSGLLAACEPISTTPPSSGVCAQNSANIIVTDGELIRGCGCAETEGEVFSTGEPLTCTVPAGTSVYFTFTATSIEHQFIISSMGATPVISPTTSGESSHETFGFSFTESGTFNFYDFYIPSLSGTIVVTP